MSADAMTEWLADASPRLKARIAGGLYLVIIVAATFALVFVRDSLVVFRDAATTATNILAHEQLYRLGGAAMLIALACDTAVAILFYYLFKPVSRSLSLLAATFRLIQVAIMAVNSLNHFAPLALLGGAQGLTAFETDQLQALSLGFLGLYAQGFNVAMVFFGFNLLLLGYLIVKSTFLPRLLGALAMLAGGSYLTHSFAYFLSPAVAAQLFPYLMVPCFVAELSLTGWLLVIGLNDQRWKEQAAAAADW